MRQVPSSPGRGHRSSGERKKQEHRDGAFSGRYSLLRNIFFYSTARAHGHTPLVVNSTNKTDRRPWMDGVQLRFSVRLSGSFVSLLSKQSQTIAAQPEKST